jgi:uncharacterized protein YpiB (UPF0302 family)
MSGSDKKPIDAIRREKEVDDLLREMREAFAERDAIRLHEASQKLKRLKEGRQ